MCVGRARPGLWGGGGSRHRVSNSGTPLFFSSGLWSSCGQVPGGLCVLGAPGPNNGAWVPYHKAAGGFVGQVTCSFLHPTTAPQMGARGVWSEALLN